MIIWGQIIFIFSFYLCSLDTDEGARYTMNDIHLKWPRKDCLQRKSHLKRSETAKRRWSSSKTIWNCRNKLKINHNWSKGNHLFWQEDPAKSSFSDCKQLEFDKLVVRIDRNKAKTSFKTSKKIRNRSEMYIIDSDARVALILAIQQPKWKGGSIFFRFFPKRCWDVLVKKSTQKQLFNVKTKLITYYISVLAKTPCKYILHST